MNAGIDSIEMAKVFEQNGYAPNECFMRTDGGHMTTSAEMLTAKELVSYMENSCGMVFDENAKFNALNMENYDVQYMNFIGSFARSSGKYFAGTDKFELITPKFDTNLTVIDYSKGTSQTGSFQEVCDNGYQNRDDMSEYTYWVTNYLKYPSNHYEIINNNVQDNSILLVIDSTAIRTAAILSLAAHRVTVIDPRFGSYESFIDAINKNSYDVIFVIQNYSLIHGEYGGLLPDGFSYAAASSMQVVDYDIPSEMVSGETYNLSVTVKNTGSDEWNELSGIRLSININGADSGRAYINPEDTVYPGEEYKFYINDFRVSENQDFTISFKMVQEGISYFAEDSKEIRVAVKKN